MFGISYDETVDKNQFYMSRNALKLIYINIEFPKISRSDGPDSASRAGEGDWKEEGRGKGKEEGRTRKKNGDRRPMTQFRLKSCTAI